MAGQKFEYDESGTTFLYFLLSFLALVIVPSTYYFWPRKEREITEEYEEDSKKCRCENCHRKISLLKVKDPWKRVRKVTIIFLLLLGWASIFALAYKIAQFDYEYANFDPYDILQISTGATTAEIRKAYKRLSLVYHPDKATGDEKTFMKLTKAYEALTDETARRNWELYGNPDGPGAMSFGIALPSWIIEKENSKWVLGIYGLVFMVALPVVVGVWWYRSVRYSGDQVLIATTQMYYYFFHKTPHTVLKRALMILAASLEYEKGHNSEIVERVTDNYELPQLIKQLSGLGEKNKERPLCFTYSIKARALLHAHLSRIPLPECTLDKDRMYIVKKCPYLIQEMVTCVSQLMMLAHAGRINRLPSLDTIENCMKLSPMIVQAMWDNKSPLLQLPHVDEDMIRHFTSKRRNIRNIHQFVRSTPEEKKSILRGLGEEQFSNIVNFCAQLPHITMDVRSEVLDDEDSGIITAGAIVTVTCTLTRDNMEVLFDQHSPFFAEDKPEELPEEGDSVDQKDIKKPLAWMKPQKKKSKSNKRSGRKSGTRSVVSNSSLQKGGGDAKIKGESDKAEDSSDVKDKDGLSDYESGNESGAESSDEDSNSEDNSQNDKSNQRSADDEGDDAEWEKFQNKLNKRERILEGKSKFSHSVHCPFFPEDKQEYWWVYVCDRKQHLLITAPYFVTNLVDSEEVQLKFTAPSKPGVYQYSVVLRSDSYLDFDMYKVIKLDVKEAKEIPTEHPQWDISDDEKEDEGEGSDISDFATDELSSDAE